MPSIANLLLTLSQLLFILPLFSSSSQLWQDRIRITPYIIGYRNGTIQRDTTKHPPFSYSEMTLLSNLKTSSSTSLPMPTTSRLGSFSGPLELKDPCPGLFPWRRVLHWLTLLQRLHCLHGSGGRRSPCHHPLLKLRTLRGWPYSGFVQWHLDLPQMGRRTQIRGPFSRIRPVASPLRRPWPCVRGGW